MVLALHSMRSIVEITVHCCPRAIILPEYAKNSALTYPLKADISQANTGQYKAQFFAFQYHPISLDQYRKCFPSPMPYHMLFRVTVELLLVSWSSPLLKPQVLAAG